MKWMNLDLNNDGLVLTGIEVDMTFDGCNGTSLASVALHDPATGRTYRITPGGYGSGLAIGVPKTKEVWQITGSHMGVALQPENHEDMFDAEERVRKLHLMASEAGCPELTTLTINHIHIPA